MKPKRTVGEPRDRLTRLCDEMLKVLDAKGAEVEDVKALVMLQDAEKGGIATYNYGEDGDLDAATDLFMHLKAIFEANGMSLLLAPLTGNPRKN